MDSLKLKDLLLELVEEMKIARITVAENEGRIQQLVEECHDKERKLEEEALKIQSLQDKHEETEIILSKASDDKLNQLEAEKTKLQLTVDSWEKEMKAIKEEVRTLQLSKYNLERTVREQQHRLQTQGQSKTSHSEQVADIENRCKQLQKEMLTYSDTLDLLRKEVTEAGALNRMLASTNSHQKCQISSLKDELEKKQQEIVKLRVHVTPVLHNSSNKEINELKLEQLNKELKQVAQVNQDLKSQLEETRLTLQVTQGQLQESQDLAQRSMTSTKMLTERAAQQEAQVTTLTKECALLSEQSTTASAENVKLRQELDEWETKKNAEILTLEKEREKAKNECANLKKAALNLEDINASWATKNQAMMKDVEDLQMKLDSQAAELDKLKVTAVMSDKDTQTPLNTSDSHPHASISRANQEECASNTQTMQTADSETHNLHVKGQQATNKSVEEGKSLSQKEDIVYVPPCTTGTGSQGIRKDSQRNEKAEVKTADIDGENKEELCTKRCKDNATDEDLPMKEIIVLEKISKGKGDGDTQKGENNIHHQLESISGKGPSDIPGHVSAGLCLNPEKDTPEKDTLVKGSQVRQNADNYDSTTTQTALTKTSPHTPDGNLEVQAAKVNSTEASGSEAVIDNLHLQSALVNSREVTKSLDKKETSLPKRDVESSLKMSIDEEHDSRGSTAKETRSSAVAPAVFGNHTNPDISDEDLVIPSTYVEENSSHCREKEYGEKKECEPVRRDCDGGVASLEAGEDGLPGSPKTRKEEMGLSVSAGSQVSVKSNYTEATKELSGFHLASEKIPGDNESVLTVKSKSMSSSQRSEDPSTSRDLEDTCKENTSDGSVTSRADEAIIQRKDDHQDIRSSQSRSRSALKDEMERPLPVKNLPVLDDNSLMRKEKSSVIKESTFLQTPLRKHALSAHDATSSQYDPKPATLMPDVTAAFSYLSNTEPLPSDSNADVQKLQKHSEAKTKFPSSPFLKKGSEIESATPFSSWKTLDQLRVKPQQQHSNPRTPVIFSHLTSSAQQLHQSLHQTTPSTTSTRISAFYPTSASLSDIAQHSTGVPKPFGVSQDTIPKTSLTQSKEIQGLMPRLTHGRSIIDRSSDRDGREKIASISKRGAESTQVGSPKYSPGTINLQNWLPPGMNMDHGGAGDAGGESESTLHALSTARSDLDLPDVLSTQYLHLYRDY